jgi:LysM repeat protein/ABC-type branched-subunit amino acid transport system substrate-binding protein
VKRIIIALVFSLIPAISLLAQEQKVRRSEIIENLRGVPYYIHFVSSGETISAIAEAYDVTTEEIIRLNPEIRDGLKANQVLKIAVKSSDQPPAKISDPVPVGEKQSGQSPAVSKGKVHTIEPKETWYGLSRLYHVPVKDLISANPGVDTLRIGMQIYIPDLMVKENQPEEKPGFLMHTVSPQETLYSLSKRYNITIDELQKHNPDLAGGLKVGQVIYIPVKPETKPAIVPAIVKQEPQTVQVKKVSPEKEITYKDYIVQRKETLYSIAKKFEVEMSDILNANPGFTGEMKKGQVIRIPVFTSAQAGDAKVMVTEPVTVVKKDEISEKPVNVPCSPSRDGSHQYKVALLIPFMLEEADSISLGDPASLRLPSEYESLDFIQFYEGALLAIDSLSKAGGNFKVYVFDADAGEHVTKTRRILANSQMADMDLIIGPFFAKSFELVASFAANHSIPVVNPLTQRSEILEENPYIFKVQPSAWSQYNETARYIAHNFVNANVLIFRRNNEENKSMATAFKTSLTNLSSGNLSIKEATYSQSFDAGLFSNLVAGKKNIVIMLTSDKALLPALLRKMNDAREKYDITLFGLPEWEDLELDSHYLLNLDTHLFNAWFVDYSQPHVKNFINSFNERFKAEPEQDELAYLGYDVSFYFLNNLFNFGKGFSKCLSTVEYHGLSTDFTFWKTESGGFENTASSVYQLKDYKRRLVNR